MRNLPSEMVESLDWKNLGDNLDAGGLFEEALTAHLQSAARARIEKQKVAEAEAEFKAYKDASETGKWAEAKEALAKAMKLEPRRFRPFDASRYRLDAVLGVGGFGTVFRCLDTEDVDRDGKPLPVAVKSLRYESLDRDPREVFGEARLLRDLHRSGSRIIRVLNWGYAYADPDDPDRKERPYIVMEYFPGETLEAIVNRDGPLKIPDFLAIATQIVEAVREAHGQKVYHRDLKPSNVMAVRLADGTWDVRVIDFGLAVRYEAGHSASMKEASGCATEKDRSLTGSLDFAPPEQRGKLRGVPVGPYSDVYAFGKTCQWLAVPHHRAIAGWPLETNPGTVSRTAESAARGRDCAGSEAQCHFRRRHTAPLARLRTNREDASGAHEPNAYREGGKADTGVKTHHYSSTSQSGRCRAGRAVGAVEAFGHGAGMGAATPGWLEPR